MHQRRVEHAPALIHADRVDALPHAGRRTARPRIFSRLGQIGDDGLFAPSRCADNSPSAGASGSAARRRFRPMPSTPRQLLPGRIPKQCSASRNGRSVMRQRVHVPLRMANMKAKPSTLMPEKAGKPSFINRLLYPRAMSRGTVFSPMRSSSPQKLSISPQNVFQRFPSAVRHRQTGGFAKS